MSCKKHIVSLSGGQDSTALTVKLLEDGHKVDYIIFCDTGNEFDEMYDYIDRLDIYLKRKFNIGIIRLKGKHSLKSLIFSPFKTGKRKGIIRGMPYSSMMSFCTRDLKKNISDRFCKSLGSDVIMYIGYVAREKNRTHDNDKKYITNSFPLIEWGWNEPDVSAFLKSRTLYNVLYDNFSRTGCKFCPKQSLDSWYALYANHYNDWLEALEWEKETKLRKAHIVNFRADYSLEELGERFKIRLENEKNQPKFDFKWEDEDVSCMCR